MAKDIVSTSTPAQRESEPDETITITWEGFDLTLPASVDDWEVKTVEAFEDGKAITSISRLLGATQANDLANKFREKTGRALKVRDYGELADVIAKAYGFERSGN